MKIIFTIIVPFIFSLSSLIFIIKSLKNMTKFYMIDKESYEMWNEIYWISGIIFAIFTTLLMFSITVQIVC